MVYEYNSGATVVPAPSDPKARGTIGIDFGGPKEPAEDPNMSVQDRIAKNFGSAVQTGVGESFKLASDIPGVKQVAGAINEWPIGAVGGALLEGLSIPGKIVEHLGARIRLMVTSKDSMPDDVKYMLDNGKDFNEIANYLVDTSRGFSDDKTANLAFQILLDPLNFTPFIFSKVRLLKPLSTIGGGLLGANLGSVLGPAGGIAGAIGGAVIARRKISGLINAADEFKRLKGAVLAGEDIGTETKLLTAGADKEAAMERIASLNREFGLDFTGKARAASTLSAALTKATSELASLEEKVKVGEVSATDAGMRLEEARMNVVTAENALAGAAQRGELAGKLGMGIYNGVIGAKNMATAPLKAIGRSMEFAGQQGILYAMDGKRMNKIQDGIAKIAGDEGLSVFQESLGHGVSRLLIFASEKIYNTHIDRTAADLARKTNAAIIEAKQSLSVQRSIGGAAEINPRTIAETMLDNAKARNADPMLEFGTTNVDTLANRVAIASTQTADGSVSSARAVMALTEDIRAAEITAVAQRLGTREGGAARKYAEIAQGSDTLSPSFRASEAVYENIDTQTRFNIQHSGTAQQAQVKFQEFFRPFALDARISGDDLIAKEREMFDEIFGEYYLPNGAAKSPESAARAAKDLTLLELTSYGKTNTSLAKLQMDVNNKIAELNKLIETKQATAADIELYDALKATFDVPLTLVTKGSATNGGIQAFMKAKKVFGRYKEILTKMGHLDPNHPELAKVPFTPISKQLIRELDDIIKAGTQLSEEDIKAIYRLITRLSDESVQTFEDANRIFVEVVRDRFDDIRNAFPGFTSPRAEGVYGDIEEVFLVLQGMLDEGVHMTPLTAASSSKVRDLLGFALGDAGLQKYDAILSGGYQLARAPKTNILSRVKRYVDPKTKEVYYSRHIMPFVDMTSPYIDNLVPRIDRYTANWFQHTYANWFNPISQNRVTSSVFNRMASYLQKAGASDDEIQRAMDELLQRSLDLKRNARGLGSNEIEQSFKRAFDATSPGRYDAFKTAWRRLHERPGYVRDLEFSAEKAVMYAFRGDKNLVGRTQYFTGGVKVAVPGIAQLTDRFWPAVKYTANPFFYTQELIESPTLNALNGVNSRVLESVLEDGRKVSIGSAEVNQLAGMGPETKVLVDHVSYTAIFRERAMKSAIGVDETRLGRLSEWMSGDKWEWLSDVKKGNRDAMVSEFTARRFTEELSKQDPLAYSMLVDHYKTTNSRSLMIMFLHDRKMQTKIRGAAESAMQVRPVGFGYSTIPDQGNVALWQTESKLRLESGIPKMFDNDRTIESAQLISDRIDEAISNLMFEGYDISRFRPALENLRAKAFAVGRRNLRAPVQRLDEAGNVIPEANVSVSARFATEKTYIDTPVVNESGEVIELRRETVLDPISELEEAIASVKAEFELVRIDKAKINLRKSILDEMFYRISDSMPGFEESRLAEAMALGHTYGEHLTVLSKLLDDMIATRLVQAGEVINTSGNIPLLPKSIGSPEAIADMVTQAINGSSGPSVIRALKNANYQLLTRHSGEEKIFRAFQYVHNKALEDANKIHYFNPDRSQFERTINHPVLGIYPYSYMFHKILPEMVKFLFHKPFGVFAPGAGYAAYADVRKYISNEIEENWDLQDRLKAMPNTISLVTQLFPGLPNDVTASVSKYIRTPVQNILTESEYGAQNLGRDIIGSVSKTGVFGFGQQALTALEELQNALGTKRPGLQSEGVYAAAEYLADRK